MADSLPEPPDSGTDQPSLDLTGSNRHSLPTSALHNNGTVLHKRYSEPGAADKGDPTFDNPQGNCSASGPSATSSSISPAPWNQHLYDGAVVSADVSRVPGGSYGSGGKADINGTSGGKEDLQRNPAFLEVSMATANRTPGASDAHAVLGDRSADKAGSGDYEMLHRGRPSTPHVYYPLGQGHSAGQGHPVATYPTCTTITTAKPCPASSEGATSPLYEARAASHPRPPESRPLLYQPGRRKGRRAAPDHDEIIELSADVTKQPRSAEEKQNSANARKDKAQDKVQAQAEVTDIPNTNFAIACMVTLCFNLPFGVLAMYLSLRAVRAFQQGQPKLGESRSRWSMVVSLLGITVTTVIISSVVLYIAMQGQKRISRHKVYGSKAGLNL